MERILITGVDGVIGGNLAATLADHCEVIGAWRNEPVDLPGCRIEECDAACGEELAALIQQESPRWIVHCGPLAQSSWDSNHSPVDPTEASLVERLAQAAAAADAALTVISTDEVFAGPGLFHEEDALRCGSGERAALAREIEDVLARHKALVVRTNAYGFSPTENYLDFAEQAWQALTNRANPVLDVESHATPILATDLAHLLLKAHQRRLQGVLHLCGAERTSPARFIAELASACSFAPVATLRTFDANRPPQPARETSLDTRRARRELGTALPLLREGLARFAEQVAHGWQSRLQGSNELCSQAA